MRLNRKGPSGGPIKAPPRTKRIGDLASALNDATILDHGNGTTGKWTRSDVADVLLDNGVPLRAEDVAHLSPEQLAKQKSLEIAAERQRVSDQLIRDGKIKVDDEGNVTAFASALIEVSTAYEAVQMRNKVLGLYKIKTVADAVAHKHLESAEILLWRPDILDSATNHSDEFIGASLTSDMIPDRPQIWFCQATRGGKMEVIWQELGDQLNHMRDDPMDLCFLTAVIVYPGVSGISFGLTGLSSTGSNIVIKIDHVEQPLGPIPNRLAAILVAACAFLKLHFVGTDGLFLKRHEQRQLEVHKRMHIPPVRTVVLRVARKPSQPKDGDEPKREYKCCFAVRGHWRRLHEPRKRDGAEVTYIEGYVKGNTDLPMAPPRETVFTVNR